MELPQSRTLMEPVSHSYETVSFKGNRSLFLAIGICFFHGRGRAVITAGITKQTGKVPSKEIERAIEMKEKYEAAPEFHSHWEIDHE